MEDNGDTIDVYEWKAGDPTPGAHDDVMTLGPVRMRPGMPLMPGDIVFLPDPEEVKVEEVGSVPYRIIERVGITAWLRPVKPPKQPPARLVVMHLLARRVDDYDKPSSRPAFDPSPTTV